MSLGFVDTFISENLDCELHLFLKVEAMQSYLIIALFHYFLSLIESLKYLSIQRDVIAQWSTTRAILIITDQIQRAIEDTLLSCGLFLD